MTIVVSMAADDEKLSIIQRVTDVASDIIGSWWMIVAQTVGIAGWFLLNLTPHSPTGHFDDKTFDLLRLLLAFQSAYTAPLILMAQRRIARKDRRVLYEIDAAEREAMERRKRLEEKVDALISHLTQRG